MIESATADRIRGVGRLRAADVAAALRVRQWSKNLLLFAGLLFAAKLGDPTRWGEASLAFAAFCAASSAAYLVNDVRDAEADRGHPAKKRRPVARGAIPPSAALAAAACLAIVAVGAAAAVGPAVALLVAAFLTLQLAYSLGLKRVVGPDVLVIALLFAIRAAAGAEAVRVRVSPWLLACTALLALFLALGKRRAELSAVGDGHRAVLSRYSVATLDRLLLAVAGATVGAYVAYAVAARDSYEMALTIPFVVVALLRYLVLIRRDGLGEAPDEILVRDRYVLPTVAAWAVTAALLLTLS